MELNSPECEIHRDIASLRIDSSPRDFLEEPMLKISAAIRSTTNRDGSVLLDVHRGKILRLNPVGSRIFEMLRLGLDEAQIANQISRDFAMNYQEVHADVLEFIGALQEREVLEAI